MPRMERTISTIEASRRKLWRLTAWESPNAVIARKVWRVRPHGEPRVYEDDPIRFGVWCAQEVARFNRTPGREAVVVGRRSTVSLWVNRVAGDQQEDEPDETEARDES